jgi:hypothetical protein
VATRKPKDPTPGTADSAAVKPNNQSPPGSIGNTNGQIVNQTAPNTSGGSTAPAPKPTEKEKGWLEWAGDILNKGEIGALNKAKDWTVGQVGNVLGDGAAGSVAKGAVEILFPTNVIDFIPGGKAVSGGRKAVKLGEEVLEQGAKKAAKEAAEAAAEKAAKEAAEKAAKEAAEKEAKAAKKADGKDGAKDKGKKKLKCGDSGKYGDLKKTTGSGKFDRDHIPSKAALKERAKELLGDLNKKQLAAIEKAGDAIAIPRQAHIDVSPTHGTKNIDLAPKDAKDLAGAAKRDVSAMEKKIDEYDEDGGCKKAYKKAAKKILKMTNADYDKMLIDIVSKVK